MVFECSKSCASLPAVLTINYIKVNFDCVFIVCRYELLYSFDIILCRRTMACSCLVSNCLFSRVDCEV